MSIPKKKPKLSDTIFSKKQKRELKGSQIFLKKSQKSIDKPIETWYNKDTKERER